MVSEVKVEKGDVEKQLDLDQIYKSIRVLLELAKLKEADRATGKVLGD